jgi:predicted ferric reductase
MCGGRIGDMMALAIATGKIVLLLILLLNLFYFLRIEFERHKKTVLMVVTIFLLILADLLWMAEEFYLSDAIRFFLHFLGVCCIGLTAMFIAVSSNIRMRKVMKRDIRAAAKH